MTHICQECSVDPESAPEQGRHLTYDAWGQVVAVRDASGSPLALYGTDADGRRITQSAGSGPTTDLYYFGGNVLEERQGPAATAQYVWGTTYVNDLLLRDDNSIPGSLGVAGSGLGRRLYAQHDANYDVTVLADASGNVVERFAYDPYGTAKAMTAGWASSTNGNGWQVGFQGMWQDLGTGLYHTPNRDYSPSLGRWIQQDPAGYVDGADLYEFDESNSPSTSDACGLDAGALRGKFTIVPNVTWKWVYDTPSIAGDTTVGVTQPQKIEVKDVDVGVEVDNNAGCPAHDCKRWVFRSASLAIDILIRVLHPRVSARGEHGWPGTGGWRYVAYHESLHVPQAVDGATSALNGLDIRTEGSWKRGVNGPAGEAELAKDGADRVKRQILRFNEEIVDKAFKAETHDLDFYQRVDEGYQSWDIPSGLGYPDPRNGNENTSNWPGSSGDES